MAEDMGDDLTAGLKKKVGPLPVGVWIIAVGAGIGIAIYMRRNASAADEIPTDAESQDFNLGGNTSTPSGAGNLGGGTNVPPTPTAPVDNDEWLRRASDALVGKGMSGSVVNAALSGFLSGAPWTEQSRAIVDMAIRAVGNPPIAPPPAPNAPPNPPNIPPRNIPPMPQQPGKAPKPTKPGPPVRPHIVRLDSKAGRADIAVTSVRGATAYQWYLNGRMVNTTPAQMVTLTRLARNTRYTVTVMPQNAAGDGPMSGGFTFTTK